MSEQLMNALAGVVRFYCGSGGATSARMAIHFCAGVLCVLGFGAVVWPGPQLYRSAVEWAEGLSDSIGELRAEVAEMKTQARVREAAARERVENRERRLSQAEGNIEVLSRTANDHERRIYRLEAK